MTDGYKTREEATAAALAEGLGALDPGEGFSVLVCVCGRQDLHDNPDHVAIMQACAQCEVTTVAPGGHA